MGKLSVAKIKFVIISECETIALTRKRRSHSELETYLKVWVRSFHSFLLGIAPYNPHSADVCGIFLSVVKSWSQKVFPF
ncbi:hypothetical protein, partial [Microcoleus sp. Pol17_C1]|uniref:hypothetical protein n=1 Tax=unclassified Microcoleus TaxID=2642155 RepID=UPI002FD38587